MTPLIEAVKAGMTEAVELLLSNHADVAAADKEVSNIWFVFNQGMTTWELTCVTCT